MKKRKLELKSEHDKRLIPQYKDIKKYRHQLFQEMLNKTRFIENTIEDIKFKYFENPQNFVFFDFLNFQNFSFIGFFIYTFLTI